MASLFVRVVMTGALYLQLQDPTTKIRHVQMCGGNQERNQDSGASPAERSLYFLTYNFPGNSAISTKIITTTTKATTNTPVISNGDDNSATTTNNNNDDNDQRSSFSTHSSSSSNDLNTSQSATGTRQTPGSQTPYPPSRGSPTSPDVSDSTDEDTRTRSPTVPPEGSITPSQTGQTDSTTDLPPGESSVDGRRRRRQVERQHGQRGNTRNSSDSPTVLRSQRQVQRGDQSQGQGAYGEKRFDSPITPRIKILQQRHGGQLSIEHKFNFLTTISNRQQLGQLVEETSDDSLISSGGDIHLQGQEKHLVRGKRSNALTLPINATPSGARTTRKADSDNRGDAACSCAIDASGNVTISLLSFWSASAPDGATLDIDFVDKPNASIHVNLSELKNNINETFPRTFPRDRISIHVRNLPGTVPYILSLAVHGNITLTCSGSDNAGAPISRMSTTAHDNRANTEATVRASGAGLYVLIVGIILAAVGLLFLVIGALVWQRYAAEHKKKQTECIEMNAFPNDQYEEVTVSPSDDPGGDKQVVVIEKDPPSKASVASVTSSHSKQADTAPPTSPMPNLDHASDSSTKDKKQTPSPDKPKSTRFNFFRRKKSKKDKDTGEREKSSYVSSQDDGEQHYSVVEQEDYEEITEVYQKSQLNKKNVKMATPLLLDVDAKAALASLKKVEMNRTEAQKRAATMPKMPLPDSRKSSHDIVKEEQEEYSHLDHSGRAVSFDLTQMETYDGVTPRSPDGDAAKSKTADVPSTTSNLFKFSPQSSNADKDATAPNEDKESAAANKENNDDDEEEEEGEHIYEAYESPVAAPDNSRPNLDVVSPEPNLTPTNSNQTSPTDSAVQAAAKPPSPKSATENKSTPAVDEKDPQASNVPKPRHGYDEVKNVDKFPEIIELHVTPKSEDSTKQSDHKDSSAAPDTSSEGQTDKDDSIVEEVSEKRQSGVGEPVVHSGNDGHVTEELSPDLQTDKQEYPTPATDGQSSNDIGSSSEEHGANVEKDNDSSKEDTSNISEPQCKQTEVTSCPADDTTSQNNDIKTENQKSESPQSENDDGVKDGPPSNDNLNTIEVDTQSVEPSKPAPDILADLSKEPTAEQEEFVIVDNVLYQPLEFSESDTKINVKL